MKVHQNIILDGADIGDGTERSGSKFCNEGKWDNFISPLLPDAQLSKHDTFIEYGSNAGLFLRLATERGYGRVIGIERSKSDCEAAKLYRKSFGMNYTIYNNLINEDFNFDALPLADVTLLANFHYHQSVPEFLDIIDHLEVKTQAVIIVSVNGVGKVPWRASPDYSDVQSAFRNWEFGSEVTPLDPGDDPHPRAMFSRMFHSPKLLRCELGSISIRNNHHDRIMRAMGWFVKRVLTEPNLDIKTTQHYVMQEKMRRGKWSQDKINEYIEGKRDLILDIAKEGMKVPIILNRTGFIIDGFHRYLAMKQLGAEYIFFRHL